MIVFVDYEHAEGHASSWGEKMLAARARITYRLEDLSGDNCMLVRYDHVTPELLDRLDARAVFISGNGTDPSRYDPASLEPLAEIVRSGRRPIFGFCGGFQFLADALGAEVSPLDVAADSPDAERLRPFPDGRLGEIGYGPVELLADHPLLAGLDAEPIMRHAHYLEVKQPPAGFDLLASTSITKVQMAVNEQRRIVGTQFHPEYWTDEHPDGEQLIRNFLTWADLTR
ncbi:type 1 glutamine amidotransferase [Ilumatobacter coccineus]|uniref:Glutamine amidotransferase domain-containing protein n=1 Tax=Ilumatobacter coccineus (strain NBRC 103263 / KCTC 29153 / YM16-304) TaxID=1313172 RepID=A0A6C7E4W8_ILUCY|nr:gamma-glutamyl-gamma-aminobutyrate hydrolase family protein [Ilumatobacter coccineus]BAN01631.1 hypothetical protein YM304_13170 [Ilumatobacter coccineus YM16-304]